MTTPVTFKTDRFTYTLEQLCYLAGLLKSNNDSIPAVMWVLHGTPQSPFGDLNQQSAVAILLTVELVDRVVKCVKNPEWEQFPNDVWNMAIREAYAGKSFFCGQEPKPEDK